MLERIAMWTILLAVVFGVTFGTAYWATDYRPDYSHLSPVCESHDFTPYAGGTLTDEDVPSIVCKVGR